MEPIKKNRREFLGLIGGVGLIGGLFLVFGKNLKSSTSKVAQKVGIKLPQPQRSLPAFPSDPAENIPGLSPLITPTKDFYQIDIGGHPDPIDQNAWKLTITGMVKRPLTITYADLLNRPLFELDDTISCVSNEVGGSLIGNARWLGCRLDDLIREAQPTNEADQILSSDSHGFAAGFPVSALDGRDAMIAIGMNGEPLTQAHGFPARLIVPGLYGYVSATKWVTNIELTRFDIKTGYWAPRGWAILGPTKMESRIDYPAAGATVASGKSHIAGVAWAPLNGISAVEVQVDGGSWLSATLGPELSGNTWRQWWLEWQVPKGSHTIVARAVNKQGEKQTSVVKDVLPDGATGWHTIHFTGI